VGDDRRKGETIGVRKLPRPFEFHWGKGWVTEEASVTTPHHEPTIQLLEYESGKKAIRFCGYSPRGQMGRYPLILGEEDLGALAKQVQKSPKLHKLLTKLVG